MAISIRFTKERFSQMFIITSKSKQIKQNGDDDDY